ncbi:MAG TPA: hypothetical protein ENK23_05740, partial [Sorangium sp.]|nr:hypothetical protein [Sorangium sp.]
MPLPSVAAVDPLHRSVKFDAVRDVILLQPETHRTAPVARTEGIRAMRGTLEGELRGCIAAYDLAGERECSIALAKIHFER